MTLTISSPPDAGQEPGTMLPTPTVAEVVARLGDVPLERILNAPPLGTATEADLLLRTEAADKRLCELVDGILVEKTMGFLESRLAHLLGFYLETFLTTHDLGAVFGADSPVRLADGQVRAPDVSFYRWARFPDGLLPEGQALPIAPDIAVEVISLSNTRREMERKVIEYFAAGTQRVWYVYPKEQRVQVFTKVDESYELHEDDLLTDDELLPGFSLSIRIWFTRARSRRRE